MPYHQRILNRLDDWRPGRADSLPHSVPGSPCHPRAAPWREVFFLSGVEAAGFSNATCFWPPLLAAQKVSKGHWGQRDKVGFPEEPDSLILLIRTGPERPKPLSSDTWHLQRWVLISQLVKVQKKHVWNQALRKSGPMSSKAFPRGGAAIYMEHGFPESHQECHPWLGKDGDAIHFGNGIPTT